MSNDIEDAIAIVMLGSRAGTEDERRLRERVQEICSLGCTNIAAKLVEFKKARVSGRFDSLMAELEFARLAATSFGCGPSFHTGDAADISFVVDGVTCLLEVVHKSSPHPFSAVFCPDPDEFTAYAAGPAWKQAACRLHTTLSALPITVQPWVAREFVEQCTNWQERERQEARCGVLADWLACELPAAVARGDTTLSYVDGTTSFDLARIDEPPGYMKGFAGLEAWIRMDGAFRTSIDDKVTKASGRLAVTGARCFLIGLAIDDAIASLGHDLLTTLLGPLVQDGTRSGAYTYRGVPAACRRWVDEARARGRGDIVDLARFDPEHGEVTGFQRAVFFDPPSVDLGGVLATYYTGAVQFVPNPFTSNEIEILRERLPRSLEPVAPK